MKMDTFFENLSQTEEYKELNIDNIDNQQEILYDIADEINGFVDERLEDLLRGKMDEETLLSLESIPYYMIKDLVNNSSIPEEIKEKTKKQITELVDNITLFSKAYIPVWYNEVKNTYINNVLNKLKEEITPKTI